MIALARYTRLERMSELRVRISAAAQEIFLEDGLDGVSMRKVADKVGVSAPAIYRHYRNKDELLDEIVASSLRVLETYLEPALEAETPLARLQQLVERFLAFSLEQPRMFECAFTVRTRGVGDLPEELARHDWSTFQLAVEQVAECMESGVFRQADVIETSIMLWAEAYGLITLYKLDRIGQGEEVFRSFYTRCIDRMFDGLMP